MLSFVISGSANLFADLVSALIQVALPEAHVERDSSALADLRGVRVTLASTDRWLFVSTGLCPDAGAAEALSNGATAAVGLNSGTEDFRRALDAVVHGSGNYVSAEIVQWMAGAAIHNGAQSTRALPPVRLTVREREVLHLTAAGLSNTEIGRALTISINTVRSHLHALSVKLDATSRTRMLANARARGLPEANGDASAILRSA
jgi:DNA-binding NarL/FixJ family response regulator